MISSATRGSAERARPRPALPREGNIHLYGTQVSVWEEHVDERAMKQVFRGLMARLLRRGWRVERDPDVIRRWPTLADTHWVGEKHGLKMVAETSGRTLKVEFYDESNVDNPNGARHDFEKYRRLSRFHRLRCVVEMAAVVRRLQEHGYVLSYELGLLPLHAAIVRVAEGRLDTTPLARFNRSWKADRFERDATGWPAEREYAQYGNAKDRDGAPIRNGDTRYFRHRGRLLRATVYTSMNNMWQLTSATGDCITYEAAFHLFQCDRPDLEPRRFVEGQEGRLQRELARAVERKDYRRTAAIARAAERLARGE